jgi:hypothetical protein
VSAAQFRENQRYMEETRREIGASEAREARAPRIHALIDAIQDKLLVELDPAKRRRLEDEFLLLSRYAQDGHEVAPEADATWRQILELEVRS